MLPFFLKLGEWFLSFLPFKIFEASPLKSHPFSMKLVLALVCNVFLLFDNKSDLFHHSHWLCVRVASLLHIDDLKWSLLTFYSFLFSLSALTIFHNFPPVFFLRKLFSVNDIQTIKP